MKILAQDELRGFAKEVIGRVGQSGIVLLQGDLASGKTTFVKEFVKAL